MGSQHGSRAAAPPQHELPVPCFARSAAWPYFSRTTSLRFSVLMVFPSFTEGGDSVRLDRLVPCATLGVQEPKQLLERFDVGAITDERLFALGRDEFVVLELLEVVRQG